jgi:predicted nucleotidyltransferase
MVSREEVLSTLKAHEAELRARGVAHVALFGSLARFVGDGTPEAVIGLK